MKIQVLGAGCPKCKALAKLVEEVVSEMGIEFELEKVTDISEIIAIGVMMTPALVIDGKVVLTGKIPSPDELKKIIDI
ncbi:TM0996/MTH895 family glutaredoxin-like protein [bacterium]|nr:TM0996/MTH895 family glutaredoxin-like protein [bacterium]